MNYSTPSLPLTGKNVKDFLSHIEYVNRSTDVTFASLPLDIVISGGGICGLACAVALSQRGHRVTVYEAAPEINAIGAGIQVAPNATRQLYKWGVKDHLGELIVSPKHLMVRRWQDGTKLGILKTRDLEARFGSPFVQIHRGDLHNALKELAKKGGTIFRTSCRVVDYDFDQPSLTLESGEEVEADLVIAVDGVRSTARERLQKEAAPNNGKAEFAAYRAALETKEVLGDPELAWLVEEPHQNCWAGPDHHCQTYSMHGNELLNLVFIAPLTSSRNADDFTQELKEHFSGWDSTLQKLIGMIKQTTKWPVWTAAHLNEWSASSGRFIVMGDAAHDMTPFLGQGAAMAVEDAALLAHLLTALRSKGDIKSALAILQAHRIPRTRQIREQAMENVHMWHMADGEQQKTRDAASNAELADTPLERSPYIYADPGGQQWLYGYDVLKAVTEGS